MSTTVTLSVSQDTYTPSGDNFGWLYVSTTQKTLLKFDLSSIPVGAVISSASLGIYHAQGANAATQWVQATTQAWSEFSPPSSVTLDATQYDSKGFASSPYGWHIWSIGALIQRWVNGTLTNNGLAVCGSGSYNQFVSKDYGMPSEAPYLTITYDPAPVNQNYAIMF